MSEIERARTNYEDDVRKRPLYHDGSPRKTWDQLSWYVQESWKVGADEGTRDEQAQSWE